MWPSSDQSNLLDPETSIYYIRTDIGSSVLCSAPLNYVLKLPFGHLPLWTIFFAYELFSPPPIFFYEI